MFRLAYTAYCCRLFTGIISFLQLSDMKLTVDGLEKERDFYFSKLRDIEVLCQEHESDDIPVLKSIMDILYATEVLLQSLLAFLSTLPVIS